jgi:N-acetylmuramoyl-L-alanine amidase
MACFISAGHHLRDSGALGSGTQENLETIKFRDLVVTICKAKGLKVITDNDNETLSQYLNRIQTGDGSVVLEFHFDASNGKASGCTAIVGVDADKNDKAFGQELADGCSQILGIPNRGVVSEAESHRGRLGLMRESGIVCLLEICFIDNGNDMAKYNANKQTLASFVANIVEKYENLI